ncbi:MAG: hypothetical protein ACI81C_003930, partial [Alteromonas macleodii]
GYQFSGGKVFLQRSFCVLVYCKCGQCSSLLEVAFATAYQLALVLAWY